MGIYRSRQLRAAFSLLIYPFAFAVLLTFVAKLLFGRPTSPPPSVTTASSSSAQLEPDTISKVLVVASTTKEDTTWLSEIPPSLNWTINHYRVDAPLNPALSVPSRSGNEAMVYLTYIIDNYESLPDVIFFHHGHPRAWHQKLSSAEEVARLRASYVLRAGYASARCLPGCENVVSLEGGEPASEMAALPLLSRKDHLVTVLENFLEPARFPGLEGAVPSQLAAPCCAQFAVSRERVLRRDREWWVKLREWLIEAPLPSMNSGRLMEHLWHVFFGMEAVQ
ncbi:hypothetical protein UCDDA912_g02260 [Diaporthe ampelina]|uniref:Uncharacterized protein n=1 Tax=Diaporthe ampelina TaxID=1214573 RepID=A0A0G2FUT0_9PEZI|nr:hypothetical protein UCDDA912_g02260 [Diaporthe ampelina]